MERYVDRWWIEDGEKWHEARKRVGHEPIPQDCAERFFDWMVEHKGAKWP